MTPCLLHARTPVLLALAVLVATGSTARAQCFVERVLADQSGAGDQLGDAIAISGATAVAGASRADFFGNNSGAAFVFRHADDGQGRSAWRSETQLVADSGAPNDLFGAAVAIDATAAPGETVVVGAYLHDHIGNDAGSAYVYTSESIGETFEWSRTAVLQAVDAAAGDRFGQAVAVSGDVIVVGAPRHDAGGSNTGSVYVYRYTGSSWGYEATLQAPTPAAQDAFGISVAVSGNVVLVGAPFNDHAGLNSGAAYAFEYTGSAWSAGEVLVADDAAPGDNFGAAVAVSGDIAIIGAALDDDGAPNQGAAYLFRFDGAWVQERKLRASDAAEDDRFGSAVSVWAGPLGDELVVVGAPSARPAGPASGAAYLLMFDGVDWLETAKLTAPEGAANDQLGWSAAVGPQFVLAGANMEDDPDAGVNAGAVHVFTNGLEDFVDCNENGEPDFCDLVSGAGLDCNGNLILDECDIAEGGGSADENGNGIPDECDDCNENGTRDDLDIESGESQDCNANGVPDECDIADGTSEDVDEDGVPDECIVDCNENGTDDADDIAQGASQDCNENGVPDECDVDPTDPDGNMEVSLDLNGDGIPDECQDCNMNLIPDFFEIASDPQRDCNGNGTLDVCEIAPAEGEENEYFCTEGCDPDCNDNKIPDACDVDPEDPDGNGSTSADANANEIPDECEDCNENGMLDSEEISSGSAADCNANGVPDECDIPVENGEPGEFFCTEGCDADCNANGIPDACEIPVANGGTCTEDCDPDCDENGVPDACDPDCDENGIPDACDIAGDPNIDLNDNGIPDVCEADCNENGFPDFLEILWQLVEDLNDNGIPDECESCVGDVDRNGVVDFADILMVLNAWGPCPPPCPPDLDANGVVDFADVIVLLPSWGVCD